MLTGVSSWGVVAQAFFERYTPLLMKARTDFPTHFLKVYICALIRRPSTMYACGVPSPTLSTARSLLRQCGGEVNQRQQSPAVWSNGRYPLTNSARGRSTI